MQKDTTRRARTKAAVRPKLRVIEGLLSFYRPGDTVYFNIHSSPLGAASEVDGVVNEVVIKNGRASLNVTAELTLLDLSIVKRVERA